MMKITKRQLRTIIKEVMGGTMDSQVLYVVIGNAGRGRQNLWPSSDSPEAYSQQEAEKLAQDLNSKQRGGYTQIHYHAKPLDQALDYVESGRARVGLKSLLGSLG